VRRREFIGLVGGAAAGWPLAVRAENTSKKIPVVGVLWHAGSAEEEDVYLTVVQQALADLGYIEGKNVRLENRFPAEQPDRFRTLARELVELKPDVIIAVTNLGAIELKKITNTIPIVLVIGVDPVSAGIVESLARPGGNVTAHRL
jgi:putative tryptophan/tyrosine transport system substrate-binding protein